jgi:tRNA(adenine34) deaminase
MAVRTTTKKAATKNIHRWVASVKTDSTHPPEGLFNKDAATIARTLASKKVSPKGATSGLRMLTYFINRAGKGLTQEHRSTLQRAKEMLSSRIKRDKAKTAGK